jgi:ISXO2-like transposase domain/Transposase zinc-ribbon domain
MARNKVQFQRGLCAARFQKLYGTEDRCHAALVKMRWPDGFVCPKCSRTEHAYCKPRRLFQCRACRTQTSVRAGTIFHKSRSPLTTWFLAMHLIASSKNDIASLELARQLGVKWDTAWLIKQKLMEVMFQRNSIYKLEGDIQIDDAYQGGEKPALPGQTGRGARGKVPFVLAVQTRDGRPIFGQMRCVVSFTKEAIRDYAKASIAAGSRVRSDGLRCWSGLDDAGMKHEPKVTGSGRPRGGDFKWVNTALGNIKSAIIGTCRSCDIQHTPRYLAAYEWRFNRRFDLDQNLARLASVAVTIKPQPYRKLASVRPKTAETLG